MRISKGRMNRCCRVKTVSTNCTAIRSTHEKEWIELSMSCQTKSVRRHEADLRMRAMSQRLIFFLSPLQCAYRRQLRSYARRRRKAALPFKEILCRLWKTRFCVHSSNRSNERWSESKIPPNAIVRPTLRGTTMSVDPVPPHASRVRSLASY